MAKYSEHFHEISLTPLIIGDAQIRGVASKQLVHDQTYTAAARFLSWQQVVCSLPTLDIHSNKERHRFDLRDNTDQTRSYLHYLHYLHHLHYLHYLYYLQYLHYKQTISSSYATVPVINKLYPALIAHNYPQLCVTIPAILLLPHVIFIQLS